MQAIDCFRDNLAVQAFFWALIAGVIFASRAFAHRCFPQLSSAAPDIAALEKKVDRLIKEYEDAKSQHRDDVRGMAATHKVDMDNAKSDHRLLQEIVNAMELKAEKQAGQLERHKVQISNLFQVQKKTHSILSDLVVQLLAPLYTSLLLKGVASLAFWHGEGLFPRDRQLSVNDLHNLNERLRSELTDLEIDWRWRELNSRNRFQRTLGP
ncbi:hypothetical protein C8R45DRAFT_1086932 [Mycena sanguinolenta]|nr:hypothetical protein C8R45DRAFT_1086932 [Mycena sanguinolenta]